MKTTLLLVSSLFLSLSFVPFALSSRQFPIFPPVVDIAGKPLEIGAAYDVLSTAFIHPEGLCLVDITSQSTGCPHDVVQCTIFDKDPIGFPVIFSAVDAVEDTVVRENTPYNIQFSVAGNCTEETVWSLVTASSPLWEFVTTDPGSPSVQFQFQKTVFGYKIHFCKVIPFPRIPVCYAIGFIEDSGYSRLVVGLGVNAVEFSFLQGNATVVKNLATS